MRIRCSFLPLFILHQNKIYRNCILSINENGDIIIKPFEQECEATQFISSAILIANNRILKHISMLPIINSKYSNLSELSSYLQKNDLYLQNDEEPTLISAGPSGYFIIK